MWERRPHIGARASSWRVALAVTAVWSVVLLDRDPAVDAVAGGRRARGRTGERRCSSCSGPAGAARPRSHSGWSVSVPPWPARPPTPSTPRRPPHSGAIPSAGPSSGNGFGGGPGGAFGGAPGGAAAPGAAGRRRPRLGRPGRGRRPRASGLPPGLGTGRRTDHRRPARPARAPPEAHSRRAASAALPGQREQPVRGRRAVGRGAGGGPGGFLSISTPGTKLVKALEAGAGHYTWVAATVNSNSAAGYQLATGDPVMAIGGFNGTDPAPTLAQFERDVAAKKIHYFISGGTGGGGGPGTGTTGTTAGQITQWVESTSPPPRSTGSRSTT